MSSTHTLPELENGRYIIANVLYGNRVGIAEIDTQMNGEVVALANHMMAPVVCTPFVSLWTR